ncbi:MAG: sugar transferase, partial [Solirubrobacterales bacterium]|nr:sugar transferase [Solirubrobacterales bacterium]
MNRGLEKLITAMVLALTSPLLIVCAILIRLEGGGSAIYRQTRVGFHGQEFEMLKLRTMVPGSDPVGVGTVVGR